MSAAMLKSRPKMWRKLIQTYTRCNFTKESDRLVALSGLARQYQSSSLTSADHPGHYVAGLWEKSLIGDLTWFCGKFDDIIERNTSSRPSSSRPAKYCAPSWSWASVLGEVDHLSPQNDNDQAKIEHIWWEPSDSGPLGNLATAHLVVTGDVRNVTYYIEDGTGRLGSTANDPDWKDGPGWTIMGSDHFFPDLEPNKPELASYIAEGEQLFCLKLYRVIEGFISYGRDVSLVLRKTETGKEYYRVGLWLVSRMDFNDEHEVIRAQAERYLIGWERKTITII